MAPPLRSADEQPPGEWLFKSQGQVFGPFSSADLVDLLFRGTVDGSTLVAGRDGAWRPLSAVPGFLVAVRKSEAKARVEAEAARVRRRAKVRRAIEAAGAVLGLGVLVLLAAGAAWILATRPELEPRLRHDLGPEIAIGSGRVGTRVATAEDEEIVVPPAVGGERAPTRSPSHPVAAAHRALDGPRHGGADGKLRGSAEGGDLVIAQYDAQRVREAVARQQASLAPCLEEEVRRTPELSGELPIEFAVGNDGKVTALWIKDARYRSGPLHDCLFQKLRGWSFDPFPGQRPVVSLAFHVGAR